MACCLQKTPESIVNKTIETELRLEFSEQAAEVKLLLLGTGESGKSTIVKQMKVLYQKGYSQEECVAFRPLIFHNMLTSMQALIQATRTLLDPTCPITDPTALELAATEPSLFRVDGDADLALFERFLTTLWKDAAIQAAFARKSQFQLTDSAAYYFDAIPRILAVDYVPTPQDILRSRVRTQAVVELRFTYSDLNFRMFDVGGQRNERRKWIHCFQDVTAVIFVVGISEYDLTLLEDTKQKRMPESLWLFNNIYNAEWFKSTNMILFLNKTDLFEHKLCVLRIPLTEAFPEYTGGFDLEAGKAYVQDKFMEGKLRPDQAQLDSRIVYSHFTAATDTENIKTVFTAVKDTILQDRLRKGGFV
jgi:GTPase SAR1 family protein